MKMSKFDPVPWALAFVFVSAGSVMLGMAALFIRMAVE